MLRTWRNGHAPELLLGISRCAVTLENSFLEREHPLTMWTSNSAPRLPQERGKHLSSQRLSYSRSAALLLIAKNSLDVHSLAMDKQDVICHFLTMKFSSKEPAFDTCHNKDEPRPHQAQWQKPTQMLQTVWVHVYEISEKGRTAETGRRSGPWPRGGRGQPAERRGTGSYWAVMQAFPSWLSWGCTTVNLLKLT